MQLPSDTPETEPRTECAGNCEAAHDESKKAFGVRGAVIAGSLGLALSACESSRPPRDIDRMALMYGPVGMMKDGATTTTGSSGTAVKEAPKSNKTE